MIWYNINSVVHFPVHCFKPRIITLWVIFKTVRNNDYYSDSTVLCIVLLGWPCTAVISVSLISPIWNHNDCLKDLRCTPSRLLSKQYPVIIILLCNAALKIVKLLFGHVGGVLRHFRDDLLFNPFKSVPLNSSYLNGIQADWTVTPYSVVIHGSHLWTTWTLESLFWGQTLPQHFEWFNCWK